MSALKAIRDDVIETEKNAHALRDAMTAISRATNTVPVTRIEWLAITFILSQTIGNVGILLIAIALLRGHP